MTGTNGPHHGGDNVPPDPPAPTPGGPNQSSPPTIHLTESPKSKFSYQAKIDVNRRSNDHSPLRIKALLAELLTQHQRVDPTFHFLPADPSSSYGPITKASDIPNGEEQINRYVKEMHDVETRNNNKTYTVVFFLNIASSMTLGTMKHDSSLFQWLRDNHIWIRAFHFKTTYDVVTAGFISHMNANLHNRDRVNEAVQEALNTYYPNLEIQLVPTTIKHGLDPRNKRVTHVVSCQVDRQQVNEAREALVKVFCTIADRLPKEIFFVPSPVNGAISYELYFDLVNAHHEHMANIRSFAISGIANLKAVMTSQDTMDTNSSVESTIEQVIMDAKVPGTNNPIFLSIEPTNASQSEGRYLLLTDKTKISAAEQMIDALVKYLRLNPNVAQTMTIPGQMIHRTNRVQVSSEFDGYAQFLVSKVPTTLIIDPAKNAWNKRRDHTRMDYDNESFPPLSASKKTRFSTTDTETTDSTDTPDSVIVDLETELAKEREHSEKRLEELRTAFTDELSAMKKEFTKGMTEAIEKSEERMTATIKTHIGDMRRTCDEVVQTALQRVETKSSEAIDHLIDWMKNNGAITNGKNDSNSPPRKQYRRDENDTTGDVDCDKNMVTPYASHASPIRNGGDPMVGDKK